MSNFERSIKTILAFLAAASLFASAAGSAEQCIKVTASLPAVIEKGRCLALEGTAHSENLQIDGRLIVPLGSTLEADNLAISGQLTVRGELWLKEGAFAQVKGQGILENLGHLTQLSGSSLQLGDKSFMQSSGSWYVKDAQIIALSQSRLKNSSVLELDDSTLALKDASLFNRGSIVLKGQARLSNAGSVENLGSIDVLQLSLLALKDDGKIVNGRKIDLEGSCTLEKNGTLINQGRFETMPHSLVYAEDEAQIVNKRHFVLLGQLNLFGQSRLLSSADLHCRKSCKISLHDQSVMVNEGTLNLEGELEEKGIKGGFFNRNILNDRR